MSNATADTSAPTSTLSALRRAVLARPDDDLPRLVYADWLDENAGDGAPCPRCEGGGRLRRDTGERRWDGTFVMKWVDCSHCRGTARVPNGFAERAEFIRVQCELSRLRTDPGRDARLDAEPMFAAGYFDAVHRNKAAFDAVTGEASPCRCERCLGVRERELQADKESVRGWFTTPGSPLKWTATDGIPRMLVCWPNGREDDGGSVVAVVRRGFVAEVRCRLADWTGGGCQACGGYGHHHRNDSLPAHAVAVNYPSLICDACSGTGRTPGVGESVVASHPVEIVTVTDKAPTETPSGWAWWRNVGLDDTDVLPAEVFDRLPDEDAVPFSHGERLCYPTRERAFAVLSTACLSLAKRRGKLKRPDEVLVTPDRV